MERLGGYDPEAQAELDRKYSRAISARVLEFFTDETLLDDIDLSRPHDGIRRTIIPGLITRTIMATPDMVSATASVNGVLVAGLIKHFEGRKADQRFVLFGEGRVKVSAEVSKSGRIFGTPRFAMRSNEVNTPSEIENVAQILDINIK